MQAQNVGLIRRSSSTALSTAQRIEPHETISDDMSIARELLQTAPHGRVPLPLTRKSSLNFRGRDGSLHDRSVVGGGGPPDARSRRPIPTSNTWTSSDGDVLSDQDEVNDRTVYIQEYDRLAKKHGVRTMNQEHYETLADDNNNTSEKQGWFRRILRRTSSTQSMKTDRNLKHRRSISDLSLKLKMRKDKLKDKDLQELVRLCGASVLYLPAEYAAGSLSVPTCFRATAQYLVQYGISTRGIFRIPGSHNIVAALYNHYCSTDEHGQVIASTIRCPTLPEHIRCDVHDVASAFKKFLSGLPGGILGSLPLLDALISIQTQLAGQAEVTRTKQSKVRARLIALAISTLRSQYRRELIYAVFGLLCMIGRAAETARREDDRGRPLPTSDLMGYRSLGIVFGPLLVGDLLEDYTMRLADPYGGLVLLPISPPKSRKERQKKTRSGEEGSAFSAHVDKIKVANSITEMLITHWREVVRHLRNISALKSVSSTKSLVTRGAKVPLLRPSASESFALRKPPDWGDFIMPNARRERSESPTPTQRPIGFAKSLAATKQSDTLTVRKQRSGPRPMSSQRLSTSRSLNILSPTLEEDPKDSPLDVSVQTFDTNHPGRRSMCSTEENVKRPSVIDVLTANFEREDLEEKQKKNPKYSPESVSPTRVPTRSTAPAVLTEALAEATLVSTSTQSNITVLREKSPQPVRRHIHYLQGTKFATKENNPNSLKTVSNIPQPTFPTKKLKSSDESENDVENHKHTTLSLSLDTLLPKQMGYDGANIPDALENTPLQSRTRKPPPQFHKDSEVHNTNFLRRVGGSESGLHPKVVTQHDRRASKSLYEDPRKKRNMLDWSKLPLVKDPLSRVSRDEDAASLATLAQVLDSPDVKMDSIKESDKISTSQGDSSSDVGSKVSKTGSIYQENQPKVSPIVGRSRITESDKTSRAEKQSSGTESSMKCKPLYLLRSELIPKTKKPMPDEQTGKEQGSPTTSGSKLAKRDSAIDNEAVQNNTGLQKEARNTSKFAASPEKECLISASSVSTIGTARAKSLNKQSLGSPNKISALVARFNAPDSIPPAPPATGPSPVKTPVTRRGNSQELNNSRKNSLVAPYTTNELSPTKSQKSGKSAKPETMQAGRNAALNDKFGKTKNLGQVEDPTPKLLRSSLIDPTPLRSPRKDFELDGSRSMNPSPRSSQSSQSQLARDRRRDRSSIVAEDSFKNEEPVQDPVQDRPLPKNLITSGPMPSPMQLPQQLAPKFYGTSNRLPREPESFVSPSAERRSSHKSIEVESVSQKKKTYTSKIESGGDPTYLLAMRGTKDPRIASLNHFEFAPAVEATVHMPAFGGPRGSVGSASPSSNEKILSPTASRPLLPSRLSTARQASTTLHCNTADFVHPESPFKDEFSNSDFFSGLFSPSTNPPPGPRNSLGLAMLYHQIRDLKLQLVAKAEENQHLKQQLEARSAAGNNLLHEELKEAKMEVEVWKRRAETAERQLEVFEKPARRSKSWLTPGGSLGKRSGQRSGMDSVTEGLQLANRIRKVLHGGNMDGAGSYLPWTTDGSSGEVEMDDTKIPGRWNSDGSTETVVRDTKGNGNGNEYSIWAKQSSLAVEPINLC